MCIQMLVGCHDFNGWTDMANAFRLNLLESNLTNKTVEAHPAISLGIAIGRQRVIGTRSIIACTLGRKVAKKYGTGIHHPLGNRQIIGRLYNQVLGGIGIGQFDGFVQTAYHNQLTVGKRLAGNLLTGQKFKLSLYFGLDGLL